MLSFSLDHRGRGAGVTNLMREIRPVTRYTPHPMDEILLGFLVIGVLVVADPDRLQTVIDRVHELIAWLAE
ncbi:MAG: hypothetical protein AB7G38_06935 [Dehalococcoidia bacterium]